MIGWTPCHVSCGCIDEDACVKAPKNQQACDLDCTDTCARGGGCVVKTPKNQPYPCPCPEGCNGCNMVYDEEIGWVLNNHVYRARKQDRCLYDNK
jgi:hypothetical protein